MRLRPETSKKNSKKIGNFFFSTGNFEKKFKKKIGNFFSIFSFLRAFVVSSCRKSGFRVFLSLRYGADLGRSRLVFCVMRLFLPITFLRKFDFSQRQISFFMFPVQKKMFSSFGKILSGFFGTV